MEEQVDRQKPHEAEVKKWRGAWAGMNAWSEGECACKAPDGQECAEVRHHKRTGRWPEFPMEPCECLCHGEPEPWDDE